MANFTPITIGAAANAATINNPLYELDTAITTLQAAGGGTAARPWAVIGSPTTQPTSSTTVLVTDHITHTGKLVRGATTIGSTLADMENRGNLANGAGSHTFTSTYALANGDSNTVHQLGFASGFANVVSGNTSAALGVQNTVAGDYSLASGYQNSLDGASDYGVIAGGRGNSLISSAYAGILAGTSSTVTNSANAAIVTGSANQISGSSSYGVIAGGIQNQIYSGAVGAFVGAGKSNYIRAVYGAIVAGENNLAYHSYAAILSGYANDVAGNNSSIINGSSNRIASNTTESANSLIGAGLQNTLIDSAFSMIGVGRQNTLTTSTYCVIDAGYINSMSGAGYSGIIAGSSNAINGASQSFIGAGTLNTIAGSILYAGIVAGVNNTVTGGLSTVLGGNTNVINGNTSTAGGTDCKVTHDLAFMWNSNGASTFNSAAHGEFAVTAYGGVRLFTNTGRSTGMTLAAGASSWTAVSSATLKGDFHSVEQSAILDRLLTVPIQTYRFKQGDGYHNTINLGPTAEAWDAAFADLLGRKTIPLDGAEIPAINEGDKLGVALAAIQALTIQVNELKAKLAN